MSKGTYYSIQVIWSIIIMGGVWFLTRNFLDVAMNSIDLNGEVVTDAVLSPFAMFLLGVAFYFILTVVWIIVGAKHVRDWKPSVIVGSIVVNILCFIVGLFVPGIMESVGEQIDKIPEMIQALLPF